MNLLKFKNKRHYYLPLEFSSTDTSEYTGQVKGKDKIEEEAKSLLPDEECA